MHGPGLRNHPNLIAAKIQTHAPVVILPPVREQFLVKQSHPPEHGRRNEPVRRHDAKNGMVIPNGAKNLLKLCVKRIIPVRHLERRKEAVLRMGIGKGHQLSEGTGFQPGVLIQKVDVVVAFFQGILHALVIGNGKS